MSITDLVINTVMEKVGLEQSHIDKAKEVIDMVTFTKEDGKDIILIQIGKNIEIKIVQ
tara:strand:+ start:169 stop:342 length:174 start_codon:yes stop_codon:yes gene_type:complete